MDGYAVLQEMADSLPQRAWKPFSAHNADKVARAAADKKSRRKRKRLRARQARARGYLSGSHRFAQHLLIASQRLHTFAFP